MTNNEPPQDPRRRRPDQSRDTQPTDPPSPPPPPPPGPSVRKFYRDPTGPIGGVATGLARYFSIDPFLVQAAFVAFAFFGGSGILVYLAAWVLVPESGSDQDGREPGYLNIVVGTVLLVAAFGGALAGLGFGSSLGGSQLFWLILLGIGVYLLGQRPDEFARAGANVGDRVRPTQTWATPQTATGGSLQTTTAFLYDSPPGAGDRVPPPPSSFQPYPPSPPTRTPGPRKANPPITSMALAAAAVAVGLVVLATQLADNQIGSAPLYGLVLAISGIGFMVGSVRGRAWGLLPVGLIAAAGIAVAPLADIGFRGGIGERSYSVESPAGLAPSYSLGAGELVMDLSALELDEDTTLHLKVGAGSMVVIVPQNVTVDITARSKFGSVILFGDQRSGTGNSIRDIHLAHLSNEVADQPIETAGSKPTLTIDAQTTFGEVEVRHG